MKKLISAILFFTVVFSASATYAAKSDTARFWVNVKCNTCKNKIMDNIAYEKGVKDIKINVEEQLVEVIYKSGKNTPEGLKEAFIKLDFKVRILKKGEKPSENEINTDGKKCTSDTTKCKGEESSKKEKACCDKTKKDSTQVKACCDKSKTDSTTTKKCSTDKKTDCKGHNHDHKNCKGDKDHSKGDKKCCSGDKKTQDSTGADSSSTGDKADCKDHDHKNCKGKDHDHGDKKCCKGDKKEDTK
jgi:mercuric ion binding protein